MVFLDNNFYFFFLLFSFEEMIIQTCKMINNKILDTKIIFKTYLKILKIG